MEIGTNESYSDELIAHVIARCTNNEFLFREPEDFTRYLNILSLAQKKFRFEINNYTLMSNHCHLILTIKNGQSLGEIMKWLNGIYSTDYNRRHGRRSHFWRARYKAIPIKDGRYALACLRYQHRNPIRAKMISNPAEWQWSGYRFYALGETNALITPLGSYLALSQDPLIRRKYYKELVLIEMPFDHQEKEIFSPPKRGRPKNMQDVLKVSLSTVQMVCQKPSVD